VTHSIASDKKDARTRAAKERAAAHALHKDTAGKILAARGLPVTPFPGRNVVSAFSSFRSEINTMPLLVRLAGEGWMTALPIIPGQGVPLIFRAWAPGEPTVAGDWGIPRPPDTAPEVEPDVLLVPLLAFDRAGYRLGYGGGFYDRTLEKLRRKKTVIAIGLAYAAQEWPEVPRGIHDQALDYVMTERGTIRCG
jgi:5-formyltetrahydrofolate cyclo-ligase